MERALLALAAAFLLAALLGRPLIAVLHYLKFGQTVREDGPKRHLVKSGTPTMGGIIFLLPTVSSSCCTARWD